MPPSMPMKTGPVCCRAAALSWMRADAVEERAALLHGLEELRDGGAHRDAVRVARVDPAEQRLHEPVDDLAAEPVGDVLADRDVVADGGRA